MTLTAMEVKEALLALDTHERAAVIEEGLASLDEERRDLPEEENMPQEDFDAAWAKEIARRINDIQTDKVHMLDYDEMMADARAQIAALHS